MPGRAVEDHRGLAQPPSFSSSCTGSAPAAAAAAAGSSWGGASSSSAAAAALHSTPARPNVLFRASRDWEGRPRGRQAAAVVLSEKRKGRQRDRRQPTASGERELRRGGGSYAFMSGRKVTQRAAAEHTQSAFSPGRSPLTWLEEGWPEQQLLASSSFPARRYFRSARWQLTWRRPAGLLLTQDRGEGGHDGAGQGSWKLLRPGQQREAESDGHLHDDQLPGRRAQPRPRHLSLAALSR